MEPETISKNETSSRSKGYFFRKVCFALLVTSVFFSGCDENDKDDTDDVFTVTFDSNGGSEVSPQTVKSGEKATEPKDPTRTDYTFDAWYKETEFTNKWNFAADIVTSNITLHAKWISAGNGNGNGDAVFLVTEINSEDEERIRRTSFEYDNQNRITKVISYYEWLDEYNDKYTWASTITYNSENLVTIVDGDGDIITFTRTGNIISVNASWWDNRNETYELNAQGLAVKYIYENIYDDGDWHKGVSTLQYQGKNLVAVISEWEEEYDGEYYSTVGHTTLTYDDKKSPFYHSNTPEWLMMFWFDFVEYGFQNNVISINWNDDEELTIEYTYNADGFPLSRKQTERWWDDGVERVWEYIETFKYGTPKSQTGISSHSNFGNSSPRRDVSKDNWMSTRNKFSRNVENNRK